MKTAIFKRQFVYLSVVTLVLLCASSIFARDWLSIDYWSAGKCGAPPSLYEKDNKKILSFVSCLEANEENALKSVKIDGPEYKAIRAHADVCNNAAMIRRFDNEIKQQKTEADRQKKIKGRRYYENELEQSQKSYLTLTGVKTDLARCTSESEQERYRKTVILNQYDIYKDISIKRR